MTKYNVVAIDENVKVVGVEQYNPAANIRAKSRFEAVEKLAAKLGFEMPEFDEQFLNRMIRIDDLEIATIKTENEVQIGMTQISIGKWGFES